MSTGTDAVGSGAGSQQKKRPAPGAEARGEPALRVRYGALRRPEAGRIKPAKAFPESRWA